MKIVQINAVYQFSSTGRNTKEIHLFLRDKGVDSYVFCTNHKDEKNGIYKIGSSLDHKLHALLSRIIGLQGYFSFFSTKKLIKRLKAIAPDAVILQNLHANYIHLPLLLGYLAKNDIPTIVVLHDCWFFTGHCCHYTADKCHKWETECHHCPILHKYNKSLFLDRSRKIYNDKKRLFAQIRRLAVVGVSDWITGEARRSLLKDARIIRRIYNWIDLEIFQPRADSPSRDSLGLAAADFVVLGVAQGWSNAKGLDKFRAIAREMPDVKVVLVGRFPADVEVPRDILAVGEVSDPQRLAGFYAMADVFVNPSIQETFGKVTAEALACGTPVIGSDTTATPELIPPRCGRTFPPNDTERLLSLIAGMRKEGKKAYGESCRRFAAERFDKEKQIERYLETINKLLAE